MKLKLLAFSAIFPLLLSACSNTVSQNHKNTRDDKIVNNSDEDETTVPVTLQLGFVALEDDGKSGEQIGCGDSIVFADKTVNENLDDEEKIERALNELFAVESSSYGESGLYNAMFHSSDLEVSNVEIDADNTVRVDITGNLISGGTCDDPRIREQIMQTIKNNANISGEPTVFINDEELDDHMDLRGQN